MQWRPSLWFALFLYSYFSSHKYLRQVLICRVSYFPRDVNIIRYVKGSRKTACGHNDFCSVRLNGPIWWFILTHRYRLLLSQFTETVMIESATGPLLLCKSRSLPTQKCHAPPAVVESSRFIDIVNPYNSATFVENRLFQIVPKQKDAMNTQNRRHDIYPSQVYRCASLLNEFKPWKDEHREAFHVIKWV